MREALIGQNSCTGMHTGLETEWFIALSRPIIIENKIKERMVKILANIDNERPLKLGEVRSIRSDGGKRLEEVELLYSPTIITKYVVNRKTNQVDFLIDDTDYKYQDLQCSLTKNVIKDIYMNFRDLYNELDNESEVIK